MAFAFDTLGYAKKLRDHGVPKIKPRPTEAAREFIMAELVTKPRSNRGDCIGGCAPASAAAIWNLSPR
jgi:hypothetical protein